MPTVSVDNSERNTPTFSTSDEDFAFDENTPRNNGQNADDDWVEAGWEGPAKPGVWSGWVGRKVDKGDRW
jgi:hypothetical protein